MTALAKPVIDKWNIADNVELQPVWEPLSVTITFDFCNGYGETSFVEVANGEDLPLIDVPQRKGFNFIGYWTEKSGNGIQYYNHKGEGIKKCDFVKDTTLYAAWTIIDYTITCELYEYHTLEYTIHYGDVIQFDFAPYREHYKFLGYYSSASYSSNEICYATSELVKFGQYYHLEIVNKNQTFNQEGPLTVYARWEKLTMTYSYQVVSSGNGYLPSRNIKIESGKEITLYANPDNNHTFEYWYINGLYYSQSNQENLKYTFTLHISYLTGEVTIYNPNYSGSATYSDGAFFLTLTPKEVPSEGGGNCVAAGTLITLADGRQVPVETLTGNEMLLVWNMYTGSFDVAPILFIDSDPAKNYQIINLFFSDGTKVKVIYEHGFYDLTLNKYVFLRKDAAQYIGHWFNKHTIDSNGNINWTSVQLTNVTITTEYTTAWSPVTNGHLCYYVNGMLSMPGATEGFVNIFEVDVDTMMYDNVMMLADIEKYGLYTYEEFSALYSIPKSIFEAFNAQYLKVSLGKGLITEEKINELIERYSEFFE